MNNAVEFKNVSFSYESDDESLRSENLDSEHSRDANNKSDLILDGANFILRYGEVALLAGFSGEGKSTVLSLMTGIIPNLMAGTIAGKIFVDGENIAGKKISALCRKIALVMQNAELQIIHDKVEDEIAFGMENFGFAKTEIEKNISDSCATMGLYRNWNTRTLSGGQKQRVITASALSTKQKIILLDEPLANLDADGSKTLMETLRELSRQGYAILVVEHRLDSVMKYVDSVWNIANKKINKIEDKEKFLKSQSVAIADICKNKNAAHIGSETEVEIENQNGGQNKTQKPEILFSLENVAFKAGGREILKDVSFDIRKGERILLCGQNGCGKTTLLRLIARLAKPSRGVIKQNLDSRFGKTATPPLSRFSGSLKRWFKKVGLVYQNPNYQLFMPTVRAEIEFGAASKEYADEMLAIFSLEKIADRHPQSLSEGQKRRVSIAAVAATKPELLILDEPTVGQDYAALRSLVNILNALHVQTQNTMIVVTHDKRCDDALSDRKILIENGTAKEI